LIDGSGTSAPASDRRLFRSLKSKNDMRLARWSAAMRYELVRAILAKHIIAAAKDGERDHGRRPLADMRCSLLFMRNNE
jgi:hypothetical protein